MTCFTNSTQNIAQIDAEFFLPLENNKNTALVCYESDAIPIHSPSTLKSPTKITTKKTWIFLHFL